jgi:hypothetical protein
MDSIAKSLIKSISNLQDDFIVIFEAGEIVFTNKSFNSFFNVISTEEYKESFGEFINNFVPHPNYFNKEKVPEGQHWIDALSNLKDNDRVVSMLSQSYEPHAFSVDIDKSVEGFSVLIFKDITQDLIKRIMIQNNSNIDEKSGAYSKKYFQQIAKSYQDAATFNEKIVCALSIVLTQEGIDHKGFVDQLLEIIRQDDMLVRWGEERFMLMFMVDEETNAENVLKKFENFVCNEKITDYGCKLKLNIQNKDEKITTFIKRI